MQTQTLTMERAEALRMWRKYREHRAYQKPIDQEIERVYHAISRGKVVIKALASIVDAGLQTNGMPALAITRADARDCYCMIDRDGSARMADERWVNGRTAKNRYFTFPEGTFPKDSRRRDGKAIVPLIPVDIRPQRGLQNYHILFEPIWAEIPPIDPMLLRRIGKGDCWLVCGAWELTEIERSAMAAFGVSARN